MDGKRMIQYMYERTGDSIWDEITKDGIGELLSVFNKFQAQVREIWIELHYNKNTDLIIGIKNFDNLISMCRYLSKNTKGQASNAWEIIAKILEKIERRKEIRSYFYIESLEFDKEEIIQKTFCPCVFFEIDYEKVRRDNKDILYIYKTIEEILGEVLETSEKILENRKMVEFAQKGTFIWIIGFMMSRQFEHRICFEPVDQRKMLDLIDVFKIDKRKLENKYLNILDSQECIVDFDYSEESFSNFGLAVYYRKKEERLKILQAWSDMGFISKEEYSDIRKFSFNAIVKWNDKQSLLVGQLAHYKYKVEDNLKVPKVYLRIKEISGNEE